jgi:molecular chaperone DnaJ
MIYRLDVTIVDAALGAKMGVPALDGDFEIAIAAGTQPGDVKVYKNRGVPVLQGYGRGDLKVIVNVIVPRHLNAEQKELLKQFKKLSSARNYVPDESFAERVRAVFHQ